jgi:hypothetical protein
MRRKKSKMSLPSTRARHQNCSKVFVENTNSKFAINIFEKSKIVKLMDTSKKINVVILIANKEQKQFKKIFKIIVAEMIHGRNKKNLNLLATYGD